MSERRFIDQLRQYASLARRKNRSYAEQINTLVALRADAIKQETEDPAIAEALVDKTKRQAMQEYGRWDADFAVTSAV